MMPNIPWVTLRFLSSCRDDFVAYRAVFGLLQTAAFEESSAGATSRVLRQFTGGI